MDQSTKWIQICPPKFGDEKVKIEAIKDLSGKDRTATLWLLLLLSLESIGRIAIWLGWIWCAHETSLRIWGKS